MVVAPPLPASPPNADRARLELIVTPLGQEARITGRVDVRTAADLRLALHAALAEGRGELRLDLDQAELGDRAALGLLIECHLRARRLGRRLVLGRLSPRTERLLRAARLIASAGPVSASGAPAYRARAARDGAEVRAEDDATVASLTG